MKIGIFGGSFNPPHYGHYKLAEEFKKVVDEVWVLVSNNPLKEYSVDYYDRVTMCNMLFDEYIHVSTFEKGLEQPTYTYATLKKLRQVYCQHEFCLLIGSDNLENWDRWKDNDKLMNEFEIYVYQRSNDITELKTKFPKVKWIESSQIDCSSSQIREDVKNGRHPNYINSSIFKYIKMKRLYG